MSLSRRIAAALDEFHARGHATPAVVEAAEAPHRLSLSVAQASPVGVQLDGLAFAADGPERSTEALRAWADRVAARVTYLMEPLVLLEVDPEGGEAELRSRQPTAREGRRAFYEVRLNRAGTLRLRRVAFDEADRRRADAPFQLSREVLERLADDLVATAG
jgi:hypothetical protein